MPAIVRTFPAKPHYVKTDFTGDFFSLFAKIEAHTPTCFLLESLGEENYDSRFSVIGFNPEVTYFPRGKNLVARRAEREDVFECENPYYELRKLLPFAGLSRNYAGGLVGYLGYTAAPYLEPALQMHTDHDFPAFEFSLFTDGLLHDKLTGEITYFHFFENRLSEIKKLESMKYAAGKTKATFVNQSVDQTTHARMVEQTKEEIIAGNTFQCQIGLQLNYEVEGNWLNIYQALREINPSPHMYFMKFENTRRLLGASPELLYRQRQGEIESYPLAGTTRRGKTKAEDQQLVRELLSDPKEIAEHNMLVDLHRNDIGRVARYGSVKVRRIFDIKKFSHVQHISSEVVGLLAKDQDMFTALAASFPAGTLSGAPKIESMKIIDRIENNARGPYGGAIGHFGVNGDCTFAIPIRTIFGADNKAFIRASGGVVYDSTAEQEYQEIMNKLAATRKALEQYS